MKYLRFALLLALSFAATEYALAQTASEGQFPFTERTPRYTVRSADVLDLTFEFSPEFNQTVTVQPDGFVTLRGAGDIHVAGQTLPQVTEAFKTAFERILNKPALAVSLKDFEKPFFTVSGQVWRPGKYDLRGDLSLTQALAIAGGFNDSAKHSQVVLFRRVSNEWFETKVFDVKKMLKGKDLAEDVRILAGDMIYVPQSRASKVRRYIPVPSMGMSITPIQ